MSKRKMIHILLVLVTNLALISWMINVTWQGNCKAIVAVVFGYPLLTGLNGLLWLILKIAKKPAYKIYKIACIVLLILFLPVISIASMY